MSKTTLGVHRPFCVCGWCQDGYQDMSPTNRPLPTWLVRELELRSDRGVTVGSMTVAELHARILAERGERWDPTSQQWVKA